MGTRHHKHCGYQSNPVIAGQRDHCVKPLDAETDKEIGLVHREVRESVRIRIPETVDHLLLEGTNPRRVA